MKEVNLNHQKLGIDTACLESGTHDFLIKVGRKIKTLRIKKNELGCSIELYEGCGVRNVNLECMLQPESYKDILGDRHWPIIDRAFIESMPEVQKAIETISKTSLCYFYLKSKY